MTTSAATDWYATTWSKNNPLKITTNQNVLYAMSPQQTTGIHGIKCATDNATVQL